MGTRWPWAGGAGEGVGRSHGHGPRPAQPSGLESCLSLFERVKHTEIFCLLVLFLNLCQRPRYGGKEEREETLQGKAVAGAQVLGPSLAALQVRWDQVALDTQSCWDLKQVLQVQEASVSLYYNSYAPLILFKTLVVSVTVVGGVALFFIPRAFSLWGRMATWALCCKEEFGEQAFGPLVEMPTLWAHIPRGRAWVLFLLLTPGSC